MRHSTLQTIAERLADVGIATFRYQFSLYGARWGCRESEAVALHTVRSAAAAAHEAANDLSILVGGHSYSGRMSSMSAAKEPIAHVKGLVFFAFPCTHLAEKAQRARNTSLMSQFRCCSYLAPVTN